ncbi:MAG: DUF2200 family protein [Pirellula sp.]
MKTTKNHDQRIAELTFASVYPHYLKKVESKGITKEELHEVICWLTGVKAKEIENPLTQKVRYLDKLVDELAKGRKMEKILRDCIN